MAKIIESLKDWLTSITKEDVFVLAFSFFITFIVIALFYWWTEVGMWMLS